MKKETKKSGSDTVGMAIIGASLAALAATTYFLFTQQSSKDKKLAKAWAIKMKGDVVEKLEKAKAVSEPIYHEIINAVAAEYEKQAKANPKEIKALAQDLKKHWETLISSVGSAKNEAEKSKKIVTKKKTIKQ